MPVRVEGPLQCQIWLGATTQRGYPVMKVDGRVTLARRVIYKRCKGPLQPGEIVVMACGERRCVRPDHMEARRRGST
jgi:ribosomal protein S28E/S33